MNDSIEKLALLVESLRREVELLRSEIKTIRDICRGCVGFQDDFR